MGGSVAFDDPACRRVVFAFLEFLETVQLPSGVDDEGLEVVKECLSDMFGVRIDDKKQQRQLSIKPRSLAEILSSALSSDKQVKVEPATSSGPTSGQRASSPSPVHAAVPAVEATVGCAQTGSTSAEDAASVRVNGGASPSGQAHRASSIEGHAKFGEFLQGLQACGYFAGTTPGSPEYLSRLEKAKQLFEERIKDEEREKSREEEEEEGRRHMDPKALAEELKAKGNAAVSARSYPQAIEFYTRAISLVDSSAIYYANRALAHTQLQEYEAAIRDCKRAIELDPKYVKAYGRLGLAYFEQGKFRDAIEWYQKALQVDPSNASMRENLQMAQQQQAHEESHHHHHHHHQPPPHQEQQPRQQGRSGPRQAPRAGPQFQPNAVPNMASSMPPGMPAELAGMIPGLVSMASQMGMDAVENRFGRNHARESRGEEEEGGHDMDDDEMAGGDEQHFNLNIGAPQLEQVMQMIMNSAGMNSAAGGGGWGMGGGGRGGGRRGEGGAPGPQGPGAAS